MHKVRVVIKLLPVLGILALVLGLGTADAAKDKPKYLFKLGEQEFFEDEFRYYFFKNNSELKKDSVKYEVETYMDLYIKFRLKVLEAIKLGRDKDPEFLEEYNGYKEQLVKPYLMESKITEELVKETYNRMKEERSASHILLKLDEDALPSDTLTVYNRLLDLKKRVQAGENFDSLAFQYSDDPSAKSNKGNLGYFSAMQMVYPFEDAVFNASVGDLAGPVRTKFGYHLIHVKDIRKALGKIQVAHIMIKTAQGQDAEKDKAAHNKAKSVHEKLMSGEEWNTLCALHSDDVQTKKRGGALNWFGTGQILKEFEQAAFALKEIGSISEPVKTRFGWHIIKLMGKRGLEPFDKVKPELEKSLSRDARSRVKKAKAIEAIKSKYGFTANAQNKTSALLKLDSTLLQGSWTFDSLSADLDKPLANIGGKNILTRNFFQFVKEQQKKRGDKNLHSYKNTLYNRFEEKSIFDYEEEQLANTNFDYRMILQEYKSGILLFALMEEKVWQKAMKDTVGLKSYYEKTKSDYKAEESADVRVFISEKAESLERTRQYLTAEKDEIDKVFNKENPLNVEVQDKTVVKGEDNIVDKYWSEGTHTHTENGRHYLISVKKINPERLKKYDETRGAVISAYQDKLENDWINELKTKYPVKVNKGTLKRIIAKIEDEL
ncbi:MAG: peptidylprolyl isomerase [Cyclobacteriaceae bacterium]